MQEGGPPNQRTGEESSSSSSPMDPPAREGNKRVRRHVQRFEPEGVKREEEEEEDNEAFQQALKNSLVETRLSDHVNIPEAITLRPALEQWAEPMEYIRSVLAQVEPYGVCKIIPPQGWCPPSPHEKGHFNRSKHFETRRQDLGRLKEGVGFSDGRCYTLDGYKAMAEAFSRDWCTERYMAQGKEAPTYEALERDYWRIIETSTEDVVVEYGNDVDTLMMGSGFPRAAGNRAEEKWKVNVVGGRQGQGGGPVPSLHDVDYYRKCGWNLNNLPLWPGSVLRHLQAPVNGVNVPWLYFGCLFASFCWHVEDNYLYSINYLHSGAPKVGVEQWYGVPGGSASKFEAVIRGIIMDSFRDQPDLLQAMTTQVSPGLLSNSGVPVYRLVQQPGEFIVTFPKAFHAGFSYGFNMGEAVNFGTSGWLPFGREAVDAYRRVGRPSVLCHERLVLTLAHNLLATSSSSSSHSSSSSPSWPSVEVEEEFRSHVISDLETVVKEEETARTRAQADGVRFGLVPKVFIRDNDLTCLDVEGQDYDEKRVCLECKDICFLSAVACRCSVVKVSCLRHHATMCSCPSHRRYTIVWHEMSELWGLLRRVKDACGGSQLQSKAVKKEEEEEPRPASS